ncbi:MAG: hypothetical protein V5B44_13840 [Candidatus Accumulibacter necessarius]|jgi:hypothetical protein|uniref:hypothetical protein n=1 Tax=Candidatus Accumulibacter necessarius TaxID=2954386 RepID=UPI002FC3B768
MMAFDTIYHKEHCGGLNKLYSLFAEFQISKRRNRRLAQSAWSPCFLGDLNRLLEHEFISREMCSPAETDREEHDFWEVGPVVRVKDTARVSMGWHLSAFEMLTSVVFAKPTKRESTVAELSDEIIQFLTRDLGLSIDRIRVTVFGGGEVLPGVVVPADLSWARCWTEAGLPETAIKYIQGPMLFLLMIDRFERAGPTCEILYNFEGKYWLEIGTAIAHDRILVGANGDWRLESASRGAYGVAFGLERLSALLAGRTTVVREDYFVHACELVWSSSSHSADLRELMWSDVVAIVDIIRLGVILWAFPGHPASNRGLPSEQLRRLVRKASLLQIGSVAETVAAVGDLLLKDFATRHERMFHDSMAGLVEQVMIPWTETWNPAGYRGLGLI